MARPVVKHKKRAKVRKQKCNHCGGVIKVYGMEDGKTICDECRCKACGRIDVLCECPREKR